MKQSGLTGRASGITLLQREQCLPTHPALPTLPTLRRRFFGYTAPGPYVFNVARLPPDATTLLVLLLLLRITTTTTTTTTTLPTLSLVFSVFTVFSVFSISFNAESPPPHGPARHLPHQLTHERCGARRLPVPPLAPHRPHRTVERSGGGRSCPPSPASPAPSAPVLDPFDLPALHNDSFRPLPEHRQRLPSPRLKVGRETPCIHPRRVGVVPDSGEGGESDGVHQLLEPWRLHAHPLEDLGHHRHEHFERVRGGAQRLGGFEMVGVGRRRSLVGKVD